MEDDSVGTSGIIEKRRSSNLSRSALILRGLGFPNIVYIDENSPNHLVIEQNERIRTLFDLVEDEGRSGLLTRISAFNHGTRERESLVNQLIRSFSEFEMQLIGEINRFDFSVDNRRRPIDIERIEQVRNPNHSPIVVGGDAVVSDVSNSRV